MEDYNPNLVARRGPNANKGGPATIELPDRVENIAWQTRPAPPSAAENALADALQEIFAAEIYALAQIIERLNAGGIAAPEGQAHWTEANFRAELARLAR